MLHILSLRGAKRRSNLISFNEIAALISFARNDVKSGFKDTG